MASSSHAGLTRRSLVGASVAGGALAATTRFAPAAHAAYPTILKPTPADQFVDFGTNAEMHWDAVDPERYLTDQARLFVRNHTSTPIIDRSTWRLRVFGDGLATPRPESGYTLEEWCTGRRTSSGHRGAGPNPLAAGPRRELVAYARRATRAAPRRTEAAGSSWRCPFPSEEGR